MAILGNLFGLGLSRSRSYGSTGLWNRGYGRQRGYFSSGMGRPRSTGFFGGSLGRMAMGGMAAWATRSLLNRRYR
jgi:hypothetical protein